MCARKITGVGDPIHVEASLPERVATGPKGKQTPEGRPSLWKDPLWPVPFSLESESEAGKWLH